MRKSYIMAYCSLSLMLAITGCSGMTSLNSSKGETSADKESTAEFSRGEEPIVPMAASQWPESGICVTCGNYDFYLSPYGHNGFSFYIFSQEALPEDMKIDIDTDRPYTFETWEIDMANDCAINEQNFRKELYQCYRGMDWAKLWNLEVKANEAKEKYEQETDKEQKAILYEEYNTRLEEYWSMNNLYRDEYEAFLEAPQQKIPEGYCYRVNVSFPQSDQEGNDLQGSEHVTMVYLTAGEWRVPVEVGNIEIAYDEPEGWDFSNTCKYITFNTPLSTNVSASLYSPSDRISNHIISKITAEKDLVINNIYLYRDEDLEQGFRVNIETEAGTQTVEWKEGREILIREGETFSIETMYIEPKRSQGKYGGNKHVFVEYECEGETYLLYGEEYMELSYDSLWEAYAQYVEGIDVESYYRDYYNEIWEGFEALCWYGIEE